MSAVQVEVVMDVRDWQRWQPRVGALHVLNGATVGRILDRVHAPATVGRRPWFVRERTGSSGVVILTYAANVEHPRRRAAATARRKP